MSKEHFNIDDYILYRYLLNDLESKQREEVENWLEKDAANRDLLESLRTLAKTADLDYFDQINVDEAWQKVKSKTVDTKQIQFWPQVMRYAAAILLLAVIGIGSYYTFFHSSVVELSARKAPYTLSDGTQVWLNTGSTLTYDPEFTNGRHVELQGEAFFEVRHDPKKPFEVELQKTKTTVLGTSFNLSGYVKDSVQLVLVTGKVAFTSGDRTIDLIPGERVIAYNQVVNKTTNTDPNFQSWKTGILTFDSTPMREVIKTLSEYYQTNLLLDDPESKNCPLTATFDNESLDEILETFEIIFNADIQKQANKTRINMQPCNP